MVFLLQTRSQVTVVFLKLKVMVEQQLEFKIKSTQFDGSTEFKPLNIVLIQEGVVYRITCVPTSE